MITKTQRATLVYLNEYRYAFGWSPTVREIAAHFGIAYNAAANRLRSLERRGFIRRRPGIARGITVIAGPAPRLVARPATRVGAAQDDR